MEEQIFTESLIEVILPKEKLKELLKDLPDSPGIYKFLDEYKQSL